LSTSLVAFLVFVGITLGLTYWASRMSRGKAAYFVAGRRLTGWQNGFALAGDVLSAASFLGFAGLIAFHGMDGLVYPVGVYASFIVVLLVVGEPLRNTGKYTVADLLAYRHHPRPVQAAAAVNTLILCTLYMIAQMVGAGALAALLLAGSGITFRGAVTIVGILMIVYVVYGGMLATTWVQITKAILLMIATILMTLLVLMHFHFSLAALFEAATHVAYRSNGHDVVLNYLRPGLQYVPPLGIIDRLSTSMALVFGAAGMPHILMRLYTVPDAKVARQSVVWAIFLIGTFSILISIVGLGAATVIGPDYISHHGGTNMSGPLLAQILGGNIFFAFVSAVAFATILAVVAGLTISASTSFAHDFWMNVVHKGVERGRGEEVLVGRIAAFAFGAISILIASALGPGANVAFLATLVLGVAASSNLPAIVLTLYWKRFNTAGAVTSMICGVLASLGLIVVSPSFMGIDAPGIAGATRHLIQAKALFPLENPAMVSIPIGFLAAVVGTLLSKERTPSGRLNQLAVRSNTGLDAEVPSAE
jgi:cation/acetate symporter